MIDSRLYIDGEWSTGVTQSPLLDKYSGEQIATVHNADLSQIDAAVAAAKRIFETSEIAIPERYRLLMRACDILRQRRDEIIAAMVAETGFSRSDNASDFARCEQTLLTSAEEAKRISGEMVPIEASPGHSGELAFTLRVPLGVVACITPFNSPLNTTAHKIAPAIAAGNAVVLKPASYTPLSAMILTEIFEAAGLPAGWLNLINGPGSSVGQALVENPDVRYVAFTGGGPAGQAIQSAAGLRRTQMELGSISGTIVCADANLDKALNKCLNTSFRKSGQVCTSLQRLLVHESIIDDFAVRLTERAEAMQLGNPRAADTDIGVMIQESEARRVESWITEALDMGVTRLTRRNREGAAMPPTVLRDVTMEMRVMREEIFGPVVCLLPFSDVEQAIDSVNDSPYGLAAGIFTSNIDVALMAARRVEVGLFNINNTSSNRADPMPYGGCKGSGFGREGPRAAIRDMTDERLVTISPN